MKFATYPNESRDGCLMLVSRDLSRAMTVSHLAPTLQTALDHWVQLAPLLEQAYSELNNGVAHQAEPFDPTRCLSPLPRAYQWLDGSAYLNHVELVRRARKADMPPEIYTDPLMYQGSSDSFLAPCAPIVLNQMQWGLDFEAEVAVITGDVACGISENNAAASIRLLMLVNDITLRNLIPNELAKGFGFLQSKPPSSCSPIALTPDELGAAWSHGKVCLPLQVTYNGQCCGRANAGDDMQFSFPTLIAHAAMTRPLAAGTIIGAGTVSNRDRARGYSCLAEARMLETIEHSEARTPYMKIGDTIRIEMLDEQGKSLFGAIEQGVVG